MQRLNHICNIVNQPFRPANKKLYQSTISFKKAEVNVEEASNSMLGRLEKHAG